MRSSKKPLTMSYSLLLIHSIFAHLDKHTLHARNYHGRTRLMMTAAAAVASLQARLP